MPQTSTGRKSGVRDSLPPEHEFVNVSSSGWFAHPAAPDWLLKRDAHVYYHTPSSSLWKRRGKLLVRADGPPRVPTLGGVGGLGGAAVGGRPGLPAAPSLLRTAFTAWVREATKARKWRDGVAGIDATLESPLPSVPNSARGLRHTPRGPQQSRRGVSPPPQDGWSEAADGWQCHPSARQWLRKETDADGPVFFHQPDESLWMWVRNGTFACVDAYHRALAAFMSGVEDTVLRTCLLSWRNQACVVGAWRKRIQFMAFSPGEDQGAEAAQQEQEDKATPLFPVRTAFLATTPRARSCSPRIPRRRCSA
mmetsp:Transcript_125144/g.348227  ORF Transcript_125144/g.348227 Transcript_125144/m.348227 type:complete len:308 (-) Transcript_125144:139-1062(-)